MPIQLCRCSFAALLIVSLQLSATLAQQAFTRAWADNVIVPQCYRSSAARSYQVHVSGVDVGVVILEQVATTTIDIQLTSTSQRRELAELLVPVPDGAVVRSFSFQGQAAEPAAELLTARQAKTAFDSIVAKMQDPALMEFAGYQLIRTSVFPVEPAGEQKVRITYEHVLRAEGDRVDYLLPRSGLVGLDTPWRIAVTIKSKRAISALYSPTHQLADSAAGGHVVATAITESASRQPGPFQLSYLLDSGAVTATLFTHADPHQASGYFLLFAGLARDAAPQAAPAIPRELTVVLDRSGSMQGEKIAQAQESALQILAGLQPGETFNIVAYNDSVEAFSPVPVAKTRETEKQAAEFVRALTARGGTNLHGALAYALGPEPAAEKLPIVLFLTDGLPTVGQTSEAAIRALATDANPFDRRVFTFGVGVDVNTPLLDRIATATRGFATFVLPGEDVEVKVGRVFQGLDGPTLAAPRLHLIGPDGQAALGRISDLLPAELPDLYAGDQLVLFGRYRGQEPLVFQLHGNYRGQPRTFQFRFEIPQQVGTQHAFVARLWASRKIAQLVDHIRDMGAQSAAEAIAAGSTINLSSAPVNQVSAPVAVDPRVKELTEEIIRLSAQFGILTEYTAFLAREGTDLSAADDVLAEAASNLQSRAVLCRTGWASVNQELNNALQRDQRCLNIGNIYLCPDMNAVSIATVQQCNTNAFYRRGQTWVDSRLVQQPQPVEPARTIQFGSPEFMELAWKLVQQGQQAAISLEGDILIQVEGEPVLIKGPPRGGSEDPAGALQNADQ